MTRFVARRPQLSSPKHRGFDFSFKSGSGSWPSSDSRFSQGPCHMERATRCLQDILSRQIFHPQVTLTVPHPFFFVCMRPWEATKKHQFKGICYKWLTFQKFHLHFGVVVFLFDKFSQFFSQQFWKGTFLRLTDSSGIHCIRHGPWSVVWRWVAQGVGGWGPLPVMAL